MNKIQSRLEEIATQEQALAEEKRKILEASRAEDLLLVRELCERHGFTATDLKGAIKMRGRGRPPATPKSKRDPNAPKRKYTRQAKSAA
jgi:hypothetical protein